LERGITFPAQPNHLRKNLPSVIEDAEQNLTPRLRWLLNQLWQEWKQIEIDIPTVTDEIERMSTEDERCRRLLQIPGFGPLVSTAMVAAIGNGAAFRRGGDFAAWLGVVPRQYSTGGKAKLFGMSKRGNIYLRRMLIRGARAAVSHQVRHCGIGTVGAPAESASAAQQGDRRHCQQTGAHRLGRAIQRPELSPPAAATAGGCLMAMEKMLRLESTNRFPLFHCHDDG
jgi:transposase